VSRIISGRDRSVGDTLAATAQQWLTAGAGWAPAIIFVITFLESLPGVSLLVPATALLLATGALVGTGTLDPVPVVGSAIAGAILGDAVGFWLSRAYGPRMVRRFLPRSQRRGYARALLLFRRFGWATIFFGRFLGPVRAVAPLVAGIAQMRERHFQTANVLSAIVWAPLLLLPGYATARGLEEAGVGNHQVLAGLALFGALALLWVALRRRLGYSAATASATSSIHALRAPRRLSVPEK
jgi:membrane protein DedA with SNARE-associated domain